MLFLNPVSTFPGGVNFWTSQVTCVWAPAHCRGLWRYFPVKRSRGAGDSCINKLMCSLIHEFISWCVHVGVSNVSGLQATVWLLWEAEENDRLSEPNALAPPYASS